MVRTIYLPAIEKRVTLTQYLRAVRFAKTNPDMLFSYGFTCWWPVTGREIVDQFRRGMHDRISQGIPYFKRGTVKGEHP